MKSKQIGQSPKTFILVFETGDELAKGLLEFAEQEKLSAASFKAVGALSSVRLGWFSWESKKYEPSVTLDESSTCSSSVTDGSYFLLSQLNHPKRTDESAPTALKLAADSFSCSANSSSPCASSSPVSKTRMNVFGD